MLFAGPGAASESPVTYWAVSFGDGASSINVSGKGIARCVK